MHGIRGTLSILAVAFALTSAWSQTPYVITGLPIAAVSADSLIEIRWSGAARPGRTAPDSGMIYYGRSPGGSRIQNYPNRVTTTVVSNQLIPGIPPQRQIYFRPSAQQDMGAGLFYFMVAWPVPGGDTLFSNELQLIVESSKATALTGPSGIITELTPTISWEKNPGIPYYHVLMSDEAIKIDSSGGSGKIDVTGISIVWQAITGATQIVYGAPDPSGTITASPPPLSPGKTYSVVVLNNYGNDPAYTSTKVGLPGSFTLRGDTLRAPVNIVPAHRDTISSDSITFRWRNLDSLANTYKVYVYVGSNLTSSENSIAAQLVVWDGEVTARTFGSSDTGWLRINAKSVLTKNHYAWKVIAVDSRGAGRAGDTTGFDYRSSTGTIRIETKEKIAVGRDTITTGVANVEIRVEVLDGSLEKPVLFYTDNNGVLRRDRPIGTYRVTAIKKGFEPSTRTMTVLEDTVSEAVLYLERPDATIYGRVVDESGIGLSLARVIGVSENGDTVSTNSDQSGSFVLNCTQGDWDVAASKAGYRSSIARDTTVVYGQSVSFGSIVLRSNPLTVSGYVVNQNGSRLIGANVKLLREATVVGEVPSTSQDATFAFSVEPGVYTLLATKTGFTTYSKSLQVVASQQSVITMESGAALVVGSIIGKSIVGGRSVYAPIPGGRVVFVTAGVERPDTVAAVADATYGQFRASLSGDRSYVVLSSAAGFGIDTEHDTLRPEPGRTESFNDTLFALARLKGGVVLVDRATRALRGPVSGVSVSLTDATGATITSGRSQPDGRFELPGIHNGTFQVRAGKDGLYADSIAPSSTVEVVEGGIVLAGRPGADSVTVFMAPGEKTIKWVADSGTTVAASVKIRSPLQKTISIRDSLSNVGPGEYVVIIDATADSIIDLSYHSFVVDENESVHVDSIILPVYHASRDTLAMSDDSITLFLNSQVPLDSAAIYFRDVNAQAFDSSRLSSSADQYVFRIRPRRDGSILLYYFRAHRGRDVYGYQQKLFQTYIRPERKLTKLEISPWADTLRLPGGNADVTFRFRGYYGSGFLFDSTIYSGRVTWSIANEQGCTKKDQGDFSVVTTTADATRNGLVRLTAKVPAGIARSGTDTSVVIHFMVTGQKLENLRVKRIDPGAPEAISASAQSRAEFAAEGLDAAGKSLTITPQWRVVPPEAGVISAFGVFRPSVRYFGTARIQAQAGSITGEYVESSAPEAKPGVEVYHVVMRKPEPDTAANYQGVTIVLPESVVTAGQTALFQLRIPETENAVQRGLRLWKLVGSAYDITERNSVALRLGGNRLASLILEIPKSEQARAARDKSRYCIARWNPDSLAWDTLANSRVSDDGSSVTTRLAGFSRYAVMVAQVGFTGELAVHPNPFSPFVTPTVRAGEEDRYGVQVHRGTCITFTVGGEYEFSEAQLRIYSVLGDLVWSVSTKDVTNGRHYVWWNGMTTEGDKLLDDWNSAIENRTAGSRMCRNGRYYVLLTLKDTQGRQKKLMKPVILIK